jgi:hypothetical protein
MQKYPSELIKTNYCELIKTNGASMTQGALEQRARRMARQLGLGVKKFSPKDRFADEYGPYWVSDPYHNAVVDSGFMTIDDVIDYLAEKGAR